MAEAATNGSSNVSIALGMEERKFFGFFPYHKRKTIESEGSEQKKNKTKTKDVIRQTSKGSRKR